MLSANRDNLTSSFPIRIPFISFCCPIGLTQIFSTLLNKYGESGHPCHVPDLRGNTWFPLRNLLSLLDSRSLDWSKFYIF